MRPVAQNRPNRPLTWRLAVIAIIVFAISLGMLGIGLAYQQTRSLMYRMMYQVERHERNIRETADYRLKQELRSVRWYLERHGAGGLSTSEGLAAAVPRWIDGLYACGPLQCQELLPTSRAPDGFHSILQKRYEELASRRPPDRALDRLDLMFDEIGSFKVILACLHVEDAEERLIPYVARLDNQRLKEELLDAQLIAGDGLEIVPAGPDLGDWSVTLDGAFRHWAIRPTAAVVGEHRRAVIGQTVASFGLTLLALLTVLAAMWFLVRLARRDFALAELKSNFVADVSHELKTPLALIRLFGETLQSGRVPTEEKRQEYYTIITRESTRLTNLINNILDFARIEAGRKEYRLEPTDVGAVVRETYENYLVELEHDGFEHELEVADRLPPVDAAPDAISQVLVNLIANAIKYSAEERFIGIAVDHDTRRGRKGVLIAVRDRGIGIRPEDRAHLFEGFFRASDGRVREKGGAGLGLALVKHIVDAHHGSIEVESRLVKGSTFRVFLPASEHEAPDRGKTDRGANAPAE